ncbi:unnamed protein product [Prorocentrum cordatum]|uniref:Protein kinase domain-containing protein n=1 Tax=Prorocentrum cordatum TaxID=2364126 RepID=A0ABN9V762_9DINO|nr:unnamed protein product [Polarella glacialis]
MVHRGDSSLLDVKIADFGLSKVIAEGASLAKTVAGTPQYWAPEVRDVQACGGSYSQAADLWSLGVVLFVMLCGKYPFDGHKLSLQEQVQRASVNMGKRGISDEAKDLVRGLLKVNPSERLRLEGCFCHPWFTGAGQLQNLSEAHPGSPQSAGRRFDSPGPLGAHQGMDGVRQGLTPVVEERNASGGSSLAQNGDERASRGSSRRPSPGVRGASGNSSTASFSCAPSGASGGRASPPSAGARREASSDEADAEDSPRGSSWRRRCWCWHRKGGPGLVLSGPPGLWWLALVQLLLVVYMLWPTRRAWTPRDAQGEERAMPLAPRQEGPIFEVRVQPTPAPRPSGEISCAVAPSPPTHDPHWQVPVVPMHNLGSEVECKKKEVFRRLQELLSMEITVVFYMHMGSLVLLDTDPHIAETMQQISQNLRDELQHKAHVIHSRILPTT